MWLGLASGVVFAQPGCINNRPCMLAADGDQRAVRRRPEWANKGVPKLSQPVARGAFPGASSSAWSRNCRCKKEATRCGARSKEKQEIVVCPTRRLLGNSWTTSTVHKRAIGASTVQVRFGGRFIVFARLSAVGKWRCSESRVSSSYYFF